MAQTRLVRLPNGQEAWIKLSDGDELRAIHEALPREWADIVRRRMGGATIEQCYRMQRRLSFEEFQHGLWVAFGRFEQYLWEMAEARARALVTQRQIASKRGILL